MTTKEIKSHLKAAKASIDAKRYEEAIGKCQVVLDSCCLPYLSPITDGVCHRCKQLSCSRVCWFGNPPVGQTARGQTAL